MNHLILGGHLDYYEWLMDDESVVIDCVALSERAFEVLRTRGHIKPKARAR
jgi:hypothetical protein